jgi:hypothetical protein
MPQYSFDVMYVKEKQMLARIGNLISRRNYDYDAVLLSHPSAVGMLFTCILCSTGDVSVITSREAARRFKVLQARQEIFDEEVPKTVLNAQLKDKLEYIDKHRISD